MAFKEDAKATVRAITIGKIAISVQLMLLPGACRTPESALSRAPAAESDGTRAPDAIAAKGPVGQTGNARSAELSPKPGNQTPEPARAPAVATACRGGDCYPADFASCSNEPAGFRPQVSLDFSAPPGQGEYSAGETRTWNDSEVANFSVARNLSSPRSPGSVLRTLFPEGHAGGGSPARFMTRNFESNSGQIYICYWIRVSQDWTDNGNVGTKTFFPRTGVYDSGNAEREYINHYVGFRSDRMSYGSFMQSHGIERNFIDMSLRLNDDRWHKIEHLWIAGTPGEPDSIIRDWIDGVKVTDSNDVVMFHAWQTPQWKYLLWDPTYGGGTNPVPRDQYFLLDHLYVSVK